MRGIIGIQQTSQNDFNLVPDFLVLGGIAQLHAHARPATIHLYDRLFADARPDGGDRDFISNLNPASKQTVAGWIEPGTDLSAGHRWQFERLGYFAVDSKTSTDDAPVINRVVTLRDSWAAG